MQPHNLPAGAHIYVSALDAVSYFISDPQYLVWHMQSEVKNVALYALDKFLFHLADGRLVIVEQWERVCVWRRTKVP